MAKFSNNAAEEVPSRPIKVAGQPSLATNSAFGKFAQMENAGALAKPSSFAKPPPLRPPLETKPSLQSSLNKDLKPSSLKGSPVSSKVAALSLAVSKDAKERPPFPRTLGLKPTEGPKEEPKPLFPKPPENRLPGLIPPKNELKPHIGLKPSVKAETQESAEKPVFPKVAGVKEKFIIASQDNSTKPLTKPASKPKPAPHPHRNEEDSHVNPFLNRVSPGSVGLKPKISAFGSTKDNEEKSVNGTNSASCPFPPLKPASNQSNPPQVLAKPSGQQKEEVKPSVANNIFRANQENSGSASGPSPLKFTIPSRVVTTGPWANNSEKEEKDKTLPKRKAVPPPFKLGPAPQKPNRPPVVNLERFQKNNGESSNKSIPPPLPPTITPQQQPPPPPPPGSHPSNQAPSLPRRTKPRVQENEENYDDVDFPPEGTGNLDESQDSEGEMYEDINEMRPTTRDDERKKKEEKKRSDQEKKEQKEKEKKEQDIRKKFKLVGPIEVIHQARACQDFKGGKNDLTIKQGDPVEIIRITDNPEGKWLGRTRGFYGYIKTTMVEIDYDSLRRKPRPSINIPLKQPDSDQEVYDDVGDQDSMSSGGQSATGGFPPPPPADDIYDGVEDDDDIPTRSMSQGEDRTDSWPRGLLKILKGKDYQKKSVRETTTKVNVTEDNGGSPTSSTRQTGKDSGDSDVYDDVEATDFPPPPKELSLNTKSLSFMKAKSDDRDSQKLKKMEKEEREFRKKFKYEGDIRVLFTTTIARPPPPRKRGAKDLQVKQGESVEVIKNVDETKVLCRNEEGKYGYVLRSCIADEDDEIYDDIADGCIYDND